MRQKAEYRVGVGASSILMILVVLAMAALSLLSLYSARSAAALSARNLAMTVSYYEATAEVQQKLALLDALLTDPSTTDTATLNAALAMREVTGITVAQDWTFSFSVDAGAQRALAVEGILRLGGAPRCTLTRHQLTSAAAPKEDAPLPLLLP